MHNRIATRYEVLGACHLMKRSATKWECALKFGGQCAVILPRLAFSSLPPPVNRARAVDRKMCPKRMTFTKNYCTCHILSPIITHEARADIKYFCRCGRLFQCFEHNCFFFSFVFTIIFNVFFIRICYNCFRVLCSRKR